MEIAWAQALLYQPPVVLGKQLLPLSVLHVLMLDAIDSPFMRGGSFDAGDLIIAVHLCGLKWVDREQFFVDAKAARAWGKSQRKNQMDDESAKFVDYISESWKIPETWKTGKGQSAKANGAYHLAVFGMRQLGMSEAEAWDCPVARLVCYRETYAEQETGESDLITDDERTGLEVLKG